MEIEASKGTLSAQNCQLVQFNVYAVSQTVQIKGKDQNQNIYYQFLEETQMVKEDAIVKMHKLQKFEDNYHYEYYTIDKETVDIKVDDLLLTNIDAIQIVRNQDSKLQKLIQIPVSENERLIEEEIEDKSQKKMDKEEIEKKLKEYKAKQEEIEKAKKKNNLGSDTDSEEERLKEEEEKKKKMINVKEVRNPNFKKGLYNKGIQEIQEKSEHESGNNFKFDYSCCSMCASKELIRAAQTGNIQLVKDILNQEDKQLKISSLFTRWGIDRDMNFIETIYQNNDLEMIKLVVDFIQNQQEKGIKLAKKPSHQLYGYNCNSKYDSYFENTAFSTSSLNNSNILCADQYNESDFSDFMLGRLFTYECSTELFDLLRVLVNYSLDDKINNQIGLAVRCGNRKLAAHLMNFVSTKRSGWGYNQLHEDVLSKDKAEDVTEFKTISIMKNPLSAVKINPLQCACINPNPDIIERLLKQQDQSQFVDDYGYRLTHYAAACVGPGPLEYLVTKVKLNPLDIIPKSQNNCLHIAAQYGRAKTVEFLLSNFMYYNLEARNNKGLCAIHLACISNDLNTVKILIEKGSKIDLKGENGMQILHYAAAFGNLEIVQYLVEQINVDINIVDYQQRSPIYYAVRNNNVSILSYLLKKGGDYDQCDQQNNTVLHTAASFGFYECVRLLFNAGCQLNLQNNSGLTPLAVAHQKCHSKIVKQLLNFEGIDVNCQVCDGKTLLFLEIENIFDSQNTFEDKMDRIELLLKKKANPNFNVQYQGTPMTLICGKDKKEIIKLAEKDLEHPENQKNAFYVDIRKQLGLQDYQGIPVTNNEYKIYYKEAVESKEVQKQIQIIDRNLYQSQVSYEMQKNKIIENFRQKLVKKKSKELFYKHEENTIIRIIKLFLKYKANPSILNYAGSSSVDLALQCRSRYTRFRAILYNTKKLDLSIGIRNELGIYNKLVTSPYIGNSIKEQNKLIPLIKEIFQIDKNVQNNINIVDNQGYSPLIKLFMNFKIEKKAIKDINGKESIQSNVQQFIDLVKLFIEYGAEPTFKVQRLSNQRAIKGCNREQKDENYDMTQELEAREERLKNEFDEEQENQNIQPEYIKLTKNAQRDYCKNGEQNLFSIVVEYQSEFIQDLFPLLFELKINITNRDCFNRTPFHLYLQIQNELKLNDLDLFLKNMKYPHLFRYQDNKGDTFIHTFLNRVNKYVTPEKEDKVQYQSALVKKLFFIKGISKIFKITNAQNQHPLMILLNQSQSSSQSKEDPFFQELLKIDEVIESITETQDNNWSCLHSLFEKKIVNVENLDKLLKFGGNKLLDTQVSFKERKGKNQKSIESENLQTPLHVLIDQGHIRKNNLKCILKYFEGRKSLKLKDIQGKNPLFYLVERGYGQDLIKDLIVPDQINDLSKVSPYQDRQSVLNVFLQAYSESDSTCEALQHLLKNGADLNFVERKDKNDRTLIVKVLEMKKFRFAEVLFQNNVDINQIFLYYENSVANTEKDSDFYHVTKQIKSFLNPLLYSIKLQDEQLLKRFIVDNHANPNIKDPFGRTALHHALNYSNCKADASFEIENLVLQNGCKLSLDSKNRSPLHYCFVKFDNDRPNFDVTEYKDSDRYIDPIQSLSSLCAGEENNEILLQADIYGKTVIHYCAIRNSAMCLRFLLKKKQNIDINQEDKFGNTPLTLAFLNKSMDVVQILIQNRADCHRQAICTIEDKFTQVIYQNSIKTEYNLFNLALQYNWQGICSLLIEFKYDLWEAYQTAIKNDKFKLARSLLFKSQAQQNQMDDKNQNMMHIFAIKGYKAEKNMQKKLFQELIKRNLDLQIQNADGKSPIYLAVENKFNYLAKHLAKDCNVDLNQQENTLKKTVMQVIVDKKEFKLLEQIIKSKSSKIDYNCQDLYKQLEEKKNRFDKDTYVFIKDQSLMHKLFENKQYDIIDYIFQNDFNKIDFSVQDRKGKTILHKINNYVAGSQFKIIKDEKDEQIELEQQLQLQESESMKIEEQTYGQDQLNKILENHPNLVNIKDNEGRTPLYYAISSHHNYLVKILVDFKSDLNNEIGQIIKQKNHYFAYFIKTSEMGAIDFSKKEEKTENNLLHLAIIHNQICIFDKLPVLFNIESKNIDGDTPLILAGKLQRKEFYKKILELNPNINAQNNEGMSFVHYACQNQDLEAIELAIKYQAQMQIKTNQHKTPLNIALEKQNYIAMAKILFETNIDVKSEFLIDMTKQTYKNNPELYVDQVQKDSLLNNYVNGDLKGFTSFIYEAKEIKTKKLKSDHWKFEQEKDQYYHEISYEVTTVKITSMLLYLIQKKISQKSSYFKKPVKQTEKEKLNNGDNQRQFYPEIPTPEGQQVILKVLQKGQNPCLKDQKGKFILFKAISKNDTFLVKVLLKFIKQNQLNDIVEDNTLRNPIHFCVEPVNYGSYQNVNLLKTIIKKGFNINHEDSQGNTPTDLAFLQDQNEMLKVLEENGGLRKKKLLNVQRSFTSVIGSIPWGNEIVDIEKDSESYKEYLQLRFKSQRVFDSTPHPQARKIASLSSGDNLDLCTDRYGYYDVLLTNLDEHKGTWGTYVYYQLQLLYCNNKRIYIVFINQGDIGKEDTYTYESVVYQKKSDAIKQFSSLFEEKSGNSWRKKNNKYFQKKDGYYNYYQPIDKMSYDQKIQEFDFSSIENGYSSKGSATYNISNDIKDIFKEILNLKNIQESFRQYNLETDLFNIDTQTLNDASKILEEIKSQTIQLQEEISNNLIDVDMDKVVELKNEICHLSNEYFSLIPERGFSNQPLDVLEDLDQIEKKDYTLNSLKLLEKTAQLIYGAHSQLHFKNIHPSDYIYRALQIRMHKIEEQHSENKLIMKYIRNSSNKQIQRIYALERKGEAERIQRHINTKNRVILFYPCSDIDILPILANGLQITLPGLQHKQTSKNSFGPGIYFTDAFQACDQYFNNNNFWNNVKQSDSLDQKSKKKSKQEQFLKQVEKDQEEIKNVKDDYEIDSYLSDDDNQKQNQGFNNFGSYNYNNRHKYVLLCEVVLGESLNMRQYKEIDNLQQNYQSIKGEGKRQPSQDHNIVLSNGCVFPSGNLQRIDLEEQRRYLNMSEIERLKYKPLNFEYNQYVVHDESQIRIRYIVQI